MLFNLKTGVRFPLGGTNGSSLRLANSRLYCRRSGLVLPIAGRLRKSVPGNGCRSVRGQPFSRDNYHFPTFCIEAQGSCLGSGLPFCSSSIEMLSGERTNAIWPSRGGRLMVTPFCISLSQVS